MFDGILFRGFGHDVVEELARHAGVPVWNGLCDRYHPTVSAGAKLPGAFKLRVAPGRQERPGVAPEDGGHRSLEPRNVEKGAVEIKGHEVETPVDGPQSTSGESD
jgi:hypothetical protein